jgi:hypothetical protein
VGSAVVISLHCRTGTPWLVVGVGLVLPAVAGTGAGVTGCEGDREEEEVEKGGERMCWSGGRNRPV